jgi:hypothetical protein
MPQGITVTTADGTTVDVTDVKRLPDEGGMRAWRALVPPGTQLAYPLDVRCALLPARTQIRLDFSDAAPPRR